MVGNSFGDKFRITTFGESHGLSLGVIIDGCPAGIKLDLKKIQKELNRRRPGQSKITSQRREQDKVEIHSGVFKGVTTGTPIMLLVRNNEVKSISYENLKDKFRPGHADYTYMLKYGLRDYRGGGRSSGRETVARVLAGAVAKQVLSKISNTEIIGCVVNVGGIEAQKRDYNFAEKNILRCSDKRAYPEMIDRVKIAIKNKDSIGGAIEIRIKNPPKGIGEPVFDKLDAKLAQAFMSIGAVKAVGIGDGIKVEEMFGSEYNDLMKADKNRIKHLSNNAGGIIGGISNGEDIVARISVKPTPTRAGVSMMLVDEKLKNKKVKISGRHDPTILPRIVPVVESMAAIVILDQLLKQRCYKGL